MLWVTVDARALDGALMGTQILVLELLRALAQTETLRLRVLVRTDRIDRQTLAELRDLSGCEVLAEHDVDDSMAPSAVFYRPQQAFSPGDIALACRLGERIVLSQLDLIAYSSPDYFPDARTWEDYRRASRHGMAAAERVTVLSEHTRNELLQNALVEQERIRVVPPGLDHRVQTTPHRPEGLNFGAREHTSESSEGQADREQAPPFLLCLGTDYVHKNRVFALRMLGELRERHGWPGTLVLAGTHIEHGSSRELEREELDFHPELRDAIVDLGPVGEPEKEWLIRHAKAVLYPSSYEGFGMVPFEAGLRGVPCLFAACSSLAEGVMGRAATIVPWDPERSAAAANALLGDPATRKRHVQLLADGARELTWQRTAAAMVEIYHEAAAAPVRVASTLARDAVAREQQLTVAHGVVVQKLIDERELVLADYNALLDEVGPARGLIGERGSLPMDLQRALLALSARPYMSRPLFTMFALLFRAARAVGRAIPCKKRANRPEDPSPATRAGRPGGP